MEKEKNGKIKGIIIFIVVVIVAIVTVGIAAAFMNKANNSNEQDNTANELREENDMPSGTQVIENNPINSTSTPKGE
jgi:flagellar basal body-associated protein FliL